MTDDASPENLRKFLESDDRAMVRMGISLAKGAGVEVTVKDFERFLDSEDVETVKTGIMLADEAGVGDEAMEMLCEPLGDEEVRWSTAKALGEIGDKRAVEPLIKALGDENGDVDTGTLLLHPVAWALGEIGDARAVEPLIESLTWALADGYAREFSVGAMLALGKIGDARAVEPISDLLGEEGVYIEDHEAAAIALGQIGEPAAESLTRSLGNSFSCEFAARALKDIGKPAVESLITALEDQFDDEFIEWGAKIVEVLGEIGDERAVTRAVKSLIKTLGNKNYVDEVRMYAAEALGEIGDKRAVEPLITALEDEDDDVRDAAKEALRKLGHEVG